MAGIIDLSQARQQLPPEMSRGVDLALVRDKRRHQHRWAAVGKFVITTEQVEGIIAKMDQSMADAKIKMAAGEPVELAAIPIPLNQKQLIGVDGPGCIKCGLHFSHEKGYGHLCEVNDETFQGAVAQQAAAGSPAALSLAAFDEAHENEGDAE